MSDAADPVVVGVDGSASSIGALRWAADEAMRRGLPLRVVHAVGASDPELNLSGQEIVDHAIARALGWQPDLAITSLVHSGRPAAELCHESERAELVVLGSRGHGGIAGFLLGSVSTQVATHARGPVLVVHNGQMWAAPEASLPSHQPVAVGVDGSPSSDLATAQAFEEAALRGVGVTAVRAWQPPGQPWRSDIRPLVLDVAEIETAERHLLSESLAPYRSKFPHVEVHLRLMPRSADAALVDASQDAQLVVVGAGGRGGFSGLLLGSTSQHVLRYARCPVLVARERRVGDRQAHSDG